MGKQGIEELQVESGRQNTDVWLEHFEIKVLFRLCPVFGGSKTIIFFTPRAVKIPAFSTDQMHCFQAYHFIEGRFLRAYQPPAKCIGTSVVVF